MNAPADESQPGLTITLRQIYDAVIATKAQVDAITATSPLEKEQRLDHERRIRSLEQRIWALPASIGAGVGGVVSTVLTIALKN